MRVHLLANSFRPEAVAAAKATASELVAKGVDVGANEEVAELLAVKSEPESGFVDSDLVITFGGDGTLIRAAHLCSPSSTPILGVHYGRFGFVTQCDPVELPAVLGAFLDGHAVIEERMMLEVEVLRGSEVVVQREATSRMTTFQIRINDQDLAVYPADGILIATPTGSTGYSLSAGGPVMDPYVEAIVLLPVMPHTLSSRPFVLGSRSSVEIEPEDGAEIVLSADGFTRIRLARGDKVRTKRSERITKLVTAQPHAFLEKLTSRLLWSRTPYGLQP